MKISLYFNYTARALFRGGQRTILAVFCVAVGVMAVVSLQLVGLMLQNALTANVRATNGGDIAVSTPGVPLKPSDLAFFDQLKSVGTISNYTAVITATGGLSNTATSLQSFHVEAVDANNFPLVGSPTFVSPNNGTVSSLLVGDQILVTQSFLDRYQKQVGDTFNLYVKTNESTGQTLPVTIAGVIANTGTFAQSGNLVLISAQYYLASAPTSLANYNLVDVTTANQAQTDAAVKAITAQFPLASTQTVADVLNTQKSTLNLINTFLEIAGLLALLIGGVGIINTMQVLLSRRKTEIAMLKTAGYRRRDLFLLFGLEASLLGLVGGILGSAAATGVSYLVRGLLGNFGLNVLYTLNIPMLFGGVVMGFATALIFGLLPIVQAANERPIQVIRDEAHRSVGSKALTLLLLLILSALFCLLATFILNGNIVLGLMATYGGLVYLLVLGGIFSLLIFAISKLPVPERLNIKQAGLVLAGLVVSAAVYQVLPVFGLFLLAGSLSGLVVVFLPRNWKVSTRLALRNLGRQRIRTMTTVLAMFIGVYGIGMVIGMTDVMQTQTINVLNRNAPYNLVATTTGAESSTLQAGLSSIPGLSSSREDPFVAAQPRAVNSQPIQQVLGSGLQQNISLLGGIEGYNPGQSIPGLTIEKGRNLNASDANTNNVLVSALLTGESWLGVNLKLGDTIELASPDGKTVRTVTIVGIVAISTSYETLGKVLAPESVVNALSAGSSTTTTVFYLKVPPKQMNQALDALGRLAPNASVQDLTGSATSFLQQLSSILDLVVTIASLSMLAALIIIANAVALAMLERRRELGILKSVGYTSISVLREFLIENGIIGGLGAFVAMLIVSAVIVVFSQQLYKMALSMEPWLVVCLILGPALLALLTTALVSWKPVRVRPLAVLRYQ